MNSLESFLNEGETKVGEIVTEPPVTPHVYGTEEEPDMFPAEPVDPEL